MKTILGSLLAATLTLPTLSSAQLNQRDDVQAFVNEMAQEHQFDTAQLNELFADVEIRQDIIDAISRPAEGKPWHQYRPIFVTESRIREGVEFARQYADILQRAEKEFGVPAEILVAIIGVETRYGRYKGRYRVMDSLATLAFEYPPRSKFFRGQLEQFLIMAREEKMDPLSMTGSYAGAMGWPQFIASSFRHYAIDFDGDGRRDLWENPADIIGSVANYFARHKWREGQPVAARANITDGNRKVAEKLAEKGYKPTLTMRELLENGISAASGTPLNMELDAALVDFEQPQGKDYWITLHNFYVITRYNHSELYAMAVYQLSEAIRSSLRSQSRG